MSATAVFLRLWRSGFRQAAVLVRVGLRDPSTLAVTNYQMASAQVATPGGGTEDPMVWSANVLDVSSIAAPGAFGETGVGLCSMTLSLSKDALPLNQMLIGSTVNVWLWDERLTTFDDALPLFSGDIISWALNAVGLTVECRQRADWNRTMQPVEVTTALYPFAPEASLGQFVPIVYGRLRDVPYRYPWPEYPLVEDVTSATVLRGAPLVLGGRRAGAAIVVDTGRGGTAPVNPACKVLCASHKVARVGQHKFGAGFYMMGAAGDTLVPIDVITPGTDIINSATEAGILVRDNTAVAWIPCMPIDVDIVANTCENPRAVLDPWNDLNYARFDWTANLKTLRLRFPAMEDLGEMVGFYMVCGYLAPTGNTNFKFRIRNLTNASTPVDGSLAVTNSRRIVMARLGTVWGDSSLNPLPTHPWAFSECEVEVGWPTSTPTITGTGTGQVWLAGFIVNYKPRQDIVQSERRITHLEVRPVGEGQSDPGKKQQVSHPYTVEETIPAVTELKGKFYANVDGWPDDGAGTYAPETVHLECGGTGVTDTVANFSGNKVPQIYKDMVARMMPGDVLVNGYGFYTNGITVASTIVDPTIDDYRIVFSAASLAGTSALKLDVALKSQLLERGPDIVHHMLRNYGGETAATVVTGAGAFGSLVDARAWLRNPRRLDMTYAFSVDKSADVMTALSWMAQGTLSYIFLDRFTDKWMMRPWRADAAVDYAWTFHADDIVEHGGIQCAMTPLSTVLTGVQVGYSYSAHNGTSLHKNRLGWDGSNAGQKYRSLRDASLTVDASNNKLDWTLSGAGPFSCTLTAGNYSVDGLATHVANQMTAADPGRGYHVVSGFTMVNGVNNAFRYNDGVADRDITPTPGKYTFEDGCAMLQGLMNTASGVTDIQVTYSRVTRKVQFSRGAVGTTLIIRRATPPSNSMKRFLIVVGWNPSGADVNPDGTPGGRVITAEFPRDDEFYVVGTISTAISLLWQSGANGLDTNRTNCSQLLGFSTLRDRDGIGVSPQQMALLADAPKSAREVPLLIAAQRYGARRDSTLDLRVVQESETALELRNRMATLFGKARVVIDFSTDMAPDIERTRVIQFAADMDAVLPYPDPDTNGSWVGKRFVVVETEQQLGPIAFYTRIRAVSLD